MKITHLIASAMIFLGVLTLTGCQNTANGFHEDWKQNAQRTADATK
jgi:predicted small secreted protein